MKIKPYEKNAKKHPKKQLDQLAKVVKEVGWRQPVVVNQHGVIVVGHGRWETYEKNKESLKEIWVIDDTGKTIMGAPETIPLTKDQEMMWRLADNKLNESDWDMGLVTEELKLLSPEMIDLSGFKRDIILQSTEDEYDVKNGLKNEVRVDKGDIWKLGSHRLMCGDSTRKEDVGRLMDGKKADMVFTDPPYGISFKSNSGKSITNDDLDIDQMLSFNALWQRVAFEFAENNCFLLAWQSPRLFYLMDMFGDWKFFRLITMYKSNRISFPHGAWINKTEPCLVFVKGNPKPTGAKYMDDCFVYTHDKESHEDSNVGHPTPKPVKMVVENIIACIEKEKSVLDLFGGSGSTLIACEQTDRSCYMMELDPKYCTVILDRWEKLTGKKAEKIWQDQL